MQKNQKKKLININEYNVITYTSSVDVLLFHLEMNRIEPQRLPKQESKL